MNLPDLSPSPGTLVEFAAFSDPGRARGGHNEDFMGRSIPATPDEARTHGWLFALADGVGGHDRGEVASRTAVEHMTAGFTEAPASEALGALLVRLVQAANSRIFELGRATGPGGSNMATTVVACALRFDRLAVAHVGDSRCYLIRRGEARPLTRDHSVAGESALRGMLPTRTNGQTPTKHLLSRSVGTQLFVNVDIAEHILAEDDILLLASDGLHNSVGAADILQAVSNDAGLETAARQLAALANQRDGSDNISVQMIRVRSLERVGMYRGRPYRLR